MAKKLIDHEEAARLLGVSADDLNSMRDRKQVFPKRDAGVWKYELEQIQKLAEERKSGGGGSWDDSLDLDDLMLEPDSIVLGDESDSPGGSTVIGKKGSKSAAGDLPPATDSLESDVRLVSDSSIFGDSPTSKGGLLDDIAADTSESDDLFGSGSLELAPEDLNLSGPSSSVRKGAGSKKSDSVLPLDEDDDELVLESKPDSDITIGGGDSGISLVDPQDSGLSLEQPLALGGSKSDSFDLGDEDIISLDEDVADDAGLKSDDDFLLTPIDDASDEPDSSSQVIALDAEEEFAGGFGSSPGMLEEDLTTAGPLVAPGLAPAAGLAGGPVMTSAGYGYEVPYSGGNIALLVVCFLFLFVGGMFMYDLMRHMWSWDSPYAWNGALIDSLAQYLP